ncbi:MAG: hypothetical protein CMG46_07785 [Candidatus Marinimicrobia bacterium]|nr:hypothetical protein [Candidatus Neomarinimicrobiota bacterium]
MSNLYSASFDDLESIRHIAEAHGFCLVKQVFSAGQMEQLESGIAEDYAAFNGTCPELMSCPSLSWVMVAPRVLDIARILLPGRICYYGESYLNYEDSIGPRTKSPFNTPHIDARGSRESLTPFWSSPTDSIFRGYRFAVYLQDYKNWSGGLMVGIGSHRGNLKQFGIGAPAKVEYKILKFGDVAFTVGWPETPLYNVPSEPGDLVIWNLRTLHSAGARRLIARPEMAMLPKFEEEIYEKLPKAFLPVPGPRNAVFFDYGNEVEEVDLYIKHRRFKHRPEELVVAKDWCYDNDEIRTIFKTNNITPRFDSIITYLCSHFDKLRKNGASNADLFSMRARLFALLIEHKEFSPYFPLLSKELFLEKAAKSQEDALNYAVTTVLKK